MTTTASTSTAISTAIGVDINIDHLIDLQKYNSDIFKYASYICDMPYLTSNIKSISHSKITYLNTNIDRPLAIQQFARILKNIESAILIEASVFEFALVHVTTKNYIGKLLPFVYDDKKNDLLMNLDETNQIENKTLRKALMDDVLKPQTIAFLTPQELHPDRWTELIKKHTIREEKKKNIAVTNLYTCWRCKENRCRMIELQTRSSDEPMTQFITCLNCYNVMRK